MNLGNRIKLLRKAMNLTQLQLAEKTDVSRIYIQAIESDRRFPSMKLLKRLAAALNVDLSYLLADLLGDETQNRVQVESILNNNNLEVWYHNTRLSADNLRLIDRVIFAMLNGRDIRDVYKFHNR